jgi:hypothetical protein
MPYKIDKWYAEDILKKQRSLDEMHKGWQPEMTLSCMLQRIRNSKERFVDISEECPRCNTYCRCKSIIDAFEVEEIPFKGGYRKKFNGEEL